MNPTPYQLFTYIQSKGYIPPMSGQIAVDSINDGKPTLGEKFQGTGEHMKEVMEVDRRNVFKAFYGETPETESTWLAGEPGHGMMLPLWAERLIHAEVMVMQEKIDCAVDYLLHTLGKESNK